MLIRSQNNKTLLVLQNLTNITVVNKGKQFEIVANGASYFGDIAKYSSEEKAIKVLDMIEEEYVYCERCKARGEEAGNIPCYVFQMPADEEVEE